MFHFFLNNSIFKRVHQAVHLIVSFISVGFLPVLVSAEVMVKPLSEVVIHPLRSAPATVITQNDSLISSKLFALVNKVNVNVSESVKKGDLLVELDCRDYDLALSISRAKVNASKAALTLAENQLNRVKQLHAKSLASQDDLEQRHASYLEAETMLILDKLSIKKAELDVTHCDIIAPFNGVVTERIISRGELANQGTPLLNLVDTSELELSVKMGTGEADRLPVKGFIFDAGNKYPVSLLNKGTVVDQKTRDLDLRFIFSDKRPLPGLAGKLVWNDPANYLSDQYVVVKDRQRGIYIKRNNELLFVPLKNAIPGRTVKIDLPLDTLVVVKGFGQINEAKILKN